MPANKIQKKYNFDSRTIHAGQPPEPVTGAVNVPISLATTYVQQTPGVHKGFEYSRSSNPTRVALEECIANLENANFGLGFSSGSAATMSILQLLEPGDHLICGDDVYGGTNRYFSQVVRTKMSIEVSFIDLTNQCELEKSLKTNTKMIWIETPTNPTLKIIDIRSVVKTLKQKDILIVVDNTFATPYFQSPMDLGADIVCHSASKYLNGHSDVISGLVVTSDSDIHKKLQFYQNAIGAIPSPFDCYMILRGIKTLSLRMRQHEKNALQIAKHFEKHSKVEKIIYPGLKSHPQHQLACEQMRGFGGMVTVVLDGGLDEAKKFFDGLQLFVCAESLGAIESLAELPAIMTHAAVPKEQRGKLGISESMIRLSVGVEDIDDLIQDIEKALDMI